MVKKNYEKKTALVFTSLLKTWFKNSKNVLIGEWCLSNISNLKYESKSKVIDIDAFKINNDTFENNQKFQIIFCDPPYKEKKINLLIENIIEMDILEKNGIVIIHRKKGDLDTYPKKFKVVDTKNYGLSTFVFGRKSN